MSAHSQAVAQHFSKASESYITAARLQQMTGNAALKFLPTQPTKVLLDLGCGPGWLHPELRKRAHRLLAVDVSEAMLHKAREQGLACQYIQADAAALPIADGCLDGVFSNLMLQWCPQPEQVCRELARVSIVGSSMVMTTLLDGTLAEFKQAYRQLGQQPPVNDFLSVDTLLQKVRAASPAIDWQLHRQTCALTYPDVLALARELKDLGANYVVDSSSRSFTGKQYWQRLNAAYPLRDNDQQLIASYEVGYLVGIRR